MSISSSPKPKSSVIPIAIVGFLVLCAAVVVLFMTRPSTSEDRYLDHTPPPGPDAKPDPPNPEKVKRLKSAAPN